MLFRSEIKTFLLEWLLNHGREPMWKHIASGHVSGVRAFIFKICIERGLIDELIDPFTKQFNHRLTKEGLRFLNGRNNTK